MKDIETLLNKYFEGETTRKKVREVYLQTIQERKRRNKA